MNAGLMDAIYHDSIRDMGTRESMTTAEMAQIRASLAQADIQKASLLKV